MKAGGRPSPMSYQKFKKIKQLMFFENDNQIKKRKYSVTAFSTLLLHVFIFSFLLSNVNLNKHRVPIGR